MHLFTAVQPLLLLALALTSLAQHPAASSPPDPTRTVAHQPPADLAPFQAAITDATFLPSDANLARFLHDRQVGGCPSSFLPCFSLHAASLCCREGTECSADAIGNVGCCPFGSVCTGTVGGVLTAGTVTIDDPDFTFSPTSVPLSLSLSTSFAPVSSFIIAGSSTTSALLFPSSIGISSSSTLGFIVNGDSTVATLNQGRRGSGGVEGWALEGLSFVAGVIAWWI